MAANQFNLTARAAKGFSQQFNERLIGCGVHGRRGDFDLQFIAQSFADLVPGSARLELYGKQSAAGGFTEKAHGRHW